MKQRARNIQGTRYKGHMIQRRQKARDMKDTKARDTKSTWHKGSKTHVRVLNIIPLHVMVLNITASCRVPTRYGTLYHCTTRYGTQ